MPTAKDTRISEVEYCISSYFYSHFAPVMNTVKTELQHNQAKETADYALSFHGIMSTLAAGSNPAASLIDNSQTFLKVTGEYNSKTAEDYVVMCKDAIAGNKAFQDDLMRLAGEWRNAVVAKVGRQRYDDVCEKLGCDLAVAYIDHRIKQMMIDKMVNDTMPKSSFDYVVRKGAQNCLLGLPQAMMKSPLEAEIDARGEAAYKPSGKEKVAARVVSFGADVVATGGFSSWGALVKLAGAEVVFAGVERYLDGKMPKDNSLTVDEIISQSLFGVNGNVLQTYRKNGLQIKAYEDDYIQSVNRMMSKRMFIPTEKPLWETWKENGFNFGAKTNVWQPFNLQPSTNFWSPFSVSSSTVNRANIPAPVAIGKENEYRSWKSEHSTANTSNSNLTLPDIPLVIAPGKEKEYLDWLAHKDNPNYDPNLVGPPKPASMQSQNTENQETPEVAVDETQAPTESQPAEQTQSNDNSWASLLENFGLNGFSDIGRNLPYIIAMLPDMLVGLLTGKTESVGLKKDIIPIASIVLGMFVRNPLLKMVLIGMGGANLLNKMGHEAINRVHPDMQAQQQRQQFKQYADEPLNGRIKDPVLKGNTLIATIDNIPCTITIPDNAAQAYACGALPLNTLANAILARNDRQQLLAEQNYRNVSVEQSQQRGQGISLK